MFLSFPAFARTQKSDPRTRAFNAALISQLSKEPAWHTLTASQLRQRMARGVLGAPPRRLDNKAEDRVISGPHGDIPLRLIKRRQARGVLLHFHSGGFVTGSHDGQDAFLYKRGKQSEFSVVSVGYRLAPEFSYPHAHDDCEAAALWLLEQGPELFGTERFVIGGESAGALLAASTLLRLRDRHQGVQEAFRLAVLSYGVFDLRGTPSARNWGETPLLLSTPLIEYFNRHYADGHWQHPDASPLLADLRDLPPALLSVGTQDPLLDDSLFMAMRWHAAGNETDLRVYPDAPHAFDALPLPVGQEADAVISHAMACVGE